MTHKKYAIAISLVAFILMIISCFSSDEVLSVIIEKLNSLFPVLALAIIGPSGYGISRLSIFDKLEDLQEKDAAKVNIESSVFRKSLYSIVTFSAACGIILFILGLIVSSKIKINIYSIDVDFKESLAIFFSFTIASTIMLLMIVIKILHNIEDLRNIVISLTIKENKRKKLLAEMLAEKEKNPFNEMDFHLKKYNQSINVNESTSQ
ncbi:hypothetical protein HC024_03215 [Methylococcaceae bacterium WWC4]|nr:hypothetical protein [Methylococcaceae bacterium WWC4]